MGHPRVPPDGIFRRHSVGTSPAPGHPWQVISLASRAVTDRAELKEARVRAGLEELADRVAEDEAGGAPSPPITVEALQTLHRVGLSRMRHALAEKDPT